MKKEDALWSYWERALKHRNKTLKESLLTENTEYLRWSREDVLSCWGEKGTEKLKKEWLKDNPKEEEEIQDHYNKLNLYIPELSSWHTMEKNPLLLEIVEFMLFCKEKKLTDFLDYGSGIGSASLLFCHNNFNTTVADISDAMLSYSKWRFERHNKKANFIDLKKEKTSKESYDCVICVEVLEHTTKPLQVVESIKESLKKDGFAFLTAPFYEDEERPQHLIHDMSIIDKFTDDTFKLAQETPNGLVYKKVK